MALLRRAQPSGPNVPSQGRPELRPPVDTVRDQGVDRLARRAVPGAPFPLTPYASIPAELAEALRGIINRHEMRTGGPLPSTIGVTSPGAGDGVTTTSQALATIIAQETNTSVCWFDCGWLATQPPNSLAVVDILDLIDDPSQVLRGLQTSPELPQLASLSPGPVPESRRNTIVRSAGFQHLLKLLGEEFDHVVFDVPPVLATATGLSLLRESASVLLVVRHRATTVAQVERALQTIAPTPTLGIVLNSYRPSVPRRLRRLLGG